LPFDLDKDSELGAGGGLDVLLYLLVNENTLEELISRDLSSTTPLGLKIPYLVMA